jgi:hypothetical protein
MEWRVHAGGKVISALLTIALALGDGRENAAADAVFVGRTPCGAEARRFLGIPSQAPCEFMAWNLALSTDGTSRVKLGVVYGVGVPNEPGFARGGTAAQLAGSWSSKREAGATTGSVYQLTIDGRRMEFRTLDDNLLHPMNSGGTLMVGTSGWSYTLTAESPSTVPHQRPALEPVPGALPLLAGVFEGRTPCAALAARLAIGHEQGCVKLKWRLTLHQDPVTRAPTGYVLEGTAFRQATRTGRWSVVRSKLDPARLIYRLDANGPGAFLSFLRADEDVLLFMADDGSLLPGDSYFSYTLNRKATADPQR